MAPAILDHDVNGRTWHRMGNADLQMSPHGVYPARGDDRWVAIACQSDEAWRSLCGVLDLEEGSDPGLSVASRRLRRQDELDALISGWTRTRDENEIVTALISAGVAAHVVQNSRECMNDPQLQHRNHLVSATHISVGEIVVEGPRFVLSRTPAQVTRAGPELGEHNVYVLEDILGYDADRIADVFASMAME